MKEETLHIPVKEILDRLNELVKPLNNKCFIDFDFFEKLKLLTIEYLNKIELKNYLDHIGYENGIEFYLFKFSGIDFDKDKKFKINNLKCNIAYKNEIVLTDHLTLGEYIYQIQIKYQEKSQYDFLKNIKDRKKEILKKIEEIGFYYEMIYDSKIQVIRLKNKIHKLRKSEDHENKTM